MNRTLLCLFALSSHVLLNAQFNWQWARQLTAETQPSVGGLVVDAAGNTVVCGSYFGTLTIGILPALTSNGQNDAYVAKFGADGTPLWVRSAGGPNFDEALDVAVDGQGRVTITGYFQSPSITIGGTTLNKLGSMDILVAQYDADGNALWAQRFGWSETSGLEWGRAIVADANNDLYVAGQYKTALPVAGLPDLQACNGREQGFLIKLDAEGNGLWSLMPQCTGDASLGLTMCNALALDPDGNVFLGGHFRGDTAYFVNDTLANIMPSGQSDDAFVVKYGPDGTELWVRAWAGLNYDKLQGLGTDSEGNLFVATTREGGYLIDGIDLPISGSNGIYRMTLWKMTPDGTAIWGRRAGDTSYYHEFLDLAVDANDDVWAGGYYENRCTFESVEFPVVGNAGFYGMFAAHYSPDGDLVDVFSERGQYPRRVNQLACDAVGGLYLAGAYRDSIAFTPLPYLVGDGTYLVNSDDLSTSIASPTGQAPAWSVAPVPADRNFTIRRSDDAFSGSLRVMDMMGREMIRSTKPGTNVEVDCSNWPDGAYVVELDGQRARIQVAH